MNPGFRTWSLPPPALLSLPWTGSWVKLGPDWDWDGGCWESLKRGTLLNGVLGDWDRGCAGVDGCWCFCFSFCGSCCSSGNGNEPSGPGDDDRIGSRFSIPRCVDGSGSGSIETRRFFLDPNSISKSSSLDPGPDPISALLVISPFRCQCSPICNSSSEGSSIPSFRARPTRRPGIGVKHGVSSPSMSSFPVRVGVSWDSRNRGVDAN